MKRQSIIIINILIIVPLAIFLFSFFFQMDQTTWRYQCIDTMKVSRDEARVFESDKNIKQDINKQIVEIKNLGANCVAIDTPYDDEFLPLLTAWVTEAHAYHLHVWFRGNFSGWEGWFGYPKNITTDQLITNTQQFIDTHANLFADGDIFTPAPEAENGWSGNYVSQKDYPRFRQFLVDEYTASLASFKNIHKHVDIWLSMNGGLARSMLDKRTIQATGNKVTIDHYVHSPSEMAEYVDYLHKQFDATIIIGEFGAPIPDINGSMSDQEQATFVSQVFAELKKRKQYVYGVNYWVLTGGSTSLVGRNFEEKPVADVARSYYQPSIQNFFNKTSLIFKN